MIPFRIGRWRSALRWPSHRLPPRSQSGPISRLERRINPLGRSEGCQACQASREAGETPFDRHFQASLANELGVKAIYADDHGNEDDWEDIMEEMEDPWMRDPAGLEFAGELIELPDILAEDAGVVAPPRPAVGAAEATGGAAAGASAAAASGDAPSSAARGYGAAIPRCTLPQALEHVDGGAGVLLALADSGLELSPGCQVVPLADLDADSAAPLLHRPVFVVPTGGPGGPADTVHALQACIRLHSVLGHPNVTLVEPGPP